MRVLTLAVVLCLASPAVAQGPMATTPNAGPAAPQPTAPSPPLSAFEGPTEDAPTVNGQPVAMGPCGPEKVKPDGALETKPHGEVEAGGGADGYRRIAGVVCQPIGQTGAVTVGVSQTQGGRGYGRR